MSRLETSGIPGDEARKLLQGVTIAAIGPITARTVRECGLDVTIEAEHYTVPGLVDALAQAIGVTRPQPEEAAV
jgi:uroporphyrinogen III methyltransferase/synthase